MSLHPGGFGAGVSGAAGMRGWGAGLLLSLLLAATALAEDLPLGRGWYLGPEGRPVTVEWQTKNLQATPADEYLRLEVAAKERGEATSEALALQPLRLYTVYLTCRRGPGLGLSASVNFVNAENQRVSRGLVWQLPEAPRPNWWPLAPYKTEYAQRFCLPPGAHEVSLQFVLTGHPDAGYNYFDLYDLRIERGAEVPYGAKLGPNLLAAGDMEAANEEGVPLGWSYWGAPAKSEVIAADAEGRTAHGGRRFLAVRPGKSCTLASSMIPIEEGRAYRLSFWARGQASLSVGVQSLDLDTWQGLRVGDAQAQSLRVEAADWTQYELTWFAEALRVRYAQPYLGITPQTEVHLDDIALQEIRP